MSLMKDHLDLNFHLKPREIFQQCKFNLRNRKPDENVVDYVAKLRKLV